METGLLSQPAPWSETAGSWRLRHAAERDHVELEKPNNPTATSLREKDEVLKAGSLTDDIRAILSAEEPRPSPPDTRQRLLQTFVGEVIEVDAGDFVAILKDETDRTRPDERVTIAMDEVVQEDRSLLTPGASFYWFIFDEVRLGTRRTLTDLRFRRLPTWSKGELADVRRKASDRARRFGIESSPRV